EVIDANGCTDQEIVNITQPVAALSVQGNVTNITCNGYTDGAIQTNVVGGTAPYQYNWSNGQQVDDIQNITAGIYQLIVTDALGCQMQEIYIITEPMPLTLDAVVNDILCYGFNNGSIDVTVNGGTLPYQYNWSNGSMNQDLQLLTPGIYALHVTDANMCAISGSWEINNADQITIQTDSVITIYVGDEVQLNANVSGGSGSFNYLWSPPDYLDCQQCQQPIASPLVTTEYVLMVADQNGCTAIGTTTVIVLHNIFVPNTFTPNGDGKNDFFTAVSNSCKEYRMFIFNRWGDKIFETEKIDAGWDGTYMDVEAKQDVYVFRIEATFFDGQYHEIIGQVNLLR
ncbi:MAG: gliding motility-associated C-terminal domain-containing protein, partial [Candidatus Competibacteraceae bacterium]|nr:gliding motility-associated C-terminal domain-containing protein [Candidatus Competibacteraceae bacterium]